MNINESGEILLQLQSPFAVSPGQVLLSPTSSSDTSADLKVEIRDRENHELVPNIPLVLTSTGSTAPRRSEGTDGTHIFPSVPFGQYSLTVEVNSGPYFPVSTTPIKVITDTEHIVYVTKGYKLSGVVQRADGVALSSATLSLTVAGSKLSVPLNPDGTFTVNRLPVGKYVLKVVPSPTGWSQDFPIEITSSDLDTTLRLK